MVGDNGDRCVYYTCANSRASRGGEGKAGTISRRKMRAGTGQDQRCAEHS